MQGTACITSGLPCLCIRYWYVWDTLLEFENADLIPATALFPSTELHNCMIREKRYVSLLIKDLSMDKHMLWIKKSLFSKAYQQKWSEWQDLNLRPLAPEASALPSCATSRCPILFYSVLWKYATKKAHFHKKLKWKVKFHFQSS